MLYDKYGEECTDEEWARIKAFEQQQVRQEERRRKLRKEWYKNNREKHYANNRKWIAKNPEKRAAAHLKNHLRTKYNITPEQYAEMLTKQDGKCAICGREPNWGKKKLDVDHCHKTGKIRGLLCSDCNIGLANFKDSPELMQKATNYVIAGSKLQ